MPQGEFTSILYEAADGVALVTLNRPERMNAYTERMGREIAAVFQRADADDDVRVVVVTGAGRAFCAGLDVSGGFDVAGGDRADTPDEKREAGEGASFLHAIFNCRKPSIAALNGSAVGIGMTMTLPMDIRIASSEAKMGFVFTRRGLVPEAGSSWFLPQLVGLPTALKWCLTGEIYKAEEFLRGGLLAEVVAPDQVLPRAMAIARTIAENTSPIAIAATRALLWRMGAASGPWEAFPVEGRLIAELGAGGDVKEGVAAFLEKRPPNFPSRVSRDMPKSYGWWKS